MIPSTHDLQPSITEVCRAHLGSDTRPDDPVEIEASAPAIASILCNSGGNLAAVRADVTLLLAGDQLALAQFEAACSFDWRQNPAAWAALRIVLSECLAALDFRLSWEPGSSGSERRAAS